MRRFIKTALGFVCYHTGVYRLLFRRKAVIVVFHRVDDRVAPDDLSCSVAEFRAYCRFFRRFFKVVSLSELLNRIEDNEDISRHLVITFDDGYLDNYTNAAVVLHDYGLPAAFFVATNFIGSDIVPWWDKNVPVSLPWMTWENLRHLHSRGFEIGAHTESHADLGKIHGAEAQREIIGARQRLETELGTEVSLFAFPYGRAEQLTEANLSLVKQAGFKCCVSGHGGVVSADADPFRLLRTPILRWFRSRYQFGWEIMLSRALRTG